MDTGQRQKRDASKQPVPTDVVAAYQVRLAIKSHIIYFSTEFIRGCSQSSAQSQAMPLFLTAANVLY